MSLIVVAPYPFLAQVFAIALSIRSRWECAINGSARSWRPAGNCSCSISPSRSVTEAEGVPPFADEGGGIGVLLVQTTVFYVNAIVHPKGLLWTKWYRI